MPACKLKSGELVVATYDLGALPSPSPGGQFCHEHRIPAPTVTAPFIPDGSCMVEGQDLEQTGHTAPSFSAFQQAAFTLSSSSLQLTTGELQVTACMCRHPHQSRVPQQMGLLQGCVSTEITGSLGLWDPLHRGTDFPPQSCGVLTSCPPSLYSATS